MKSLLLIFISLVTTTALSQWKYSRVNNGFDPPYVIGYATNNTSAFLKLENYNGISFYISGVYVCDDNIDVDVSFNVSGEYHKHTLTGIVTEDRKTVFIMDDIAADSAFLKDFKDAGIVRIRLNDKTCSAEIYEFSMANSKTVYDIVVKQ